jgi:hypothetical protein
VASNKKAPRGDAGGAFDVVLLFEIFSGADRPARRDGGGDSDTGDEAASQQALTG